MKSYSECFKMAELADNELRHADNMSDLELSLYFHGVLTALEWIRELKSDEELLLDE